MNTLFAKETAHRMKNKLKAKLRDWLFKDYKWICRSQVVRLICVKQWENRDRLYIVKLLEDLKADLK